MRNYVLLIFVFGVPYVSSLKKKTNINFFTIDKTLIFYNFFKPIKNDLKTAIKNRFVFK